MAPDIAHTLPPRPNRRRPLPTVRFTNFKAIAAAEFVPSPLTVLAGANSSGKSSLLQAILFCVQSNGEASTVINGDLVRLGKPDDIVRAKTDGMSIEIAEAFIEADPDNQPTPVEYAMRLSFSPREDLLAPTEFEVWKQGERLLTAREGVHPDGVHPNDGEALLAVDTNDALGLPEETWIGIASLSPHRLMVPVDTKALRESFDQILTDATAGDLAAIDELWSLIAAQDVDDEIPEELNAELFRKVQTSRMEHRRGIQLDSKERELLFTFYRQAEAPKGWVTQAISRRTARRANASSPLTAGIGPEFTPVMRAINLLTERLAVLAASTFYLGPLREDPKVAYPLGHASTSLPVGEKGQFTAVFLERNRLMKPEYVDPDNRDRRADTLGMAVSKWCRFLDIGTTVGVKSQGKMGYQLMLTLNGQERDMTAIGVGASQLIPVVVLVLGAPQGSVVMLEQPELHLHPAVQSRLANFFALARPDLRLIVETHSEYLITRLRQLVAAGQSTPERVRVLFADQEEGVTRFDHLNVTDSGDFDHWPAGFFDTLDSEFVELARAVTGRPKAVE